MKQTLILVLACACALTLGCNKGPKKPADLPDLYPTTITVTYDDGEPVPDATVVLRLAQQGGGRSWNCAGTTDAQGKVEMMTDGNWKGVPAGDYQGMVTKEVSEAEEPTEVGGSIKVKSITRYVKTVYGDPNASGLTAQIKSGTNEIQFKVGEKIEEDVQVL
jgi:hypothetical protein